MSGWALGGALVSNVEVTAATVQRGDVIQLGGLPCRVADLFQLPQGAKQLLFESGLAVRYKVSTVTLRNALAVLQSEGPVERIHGKGNFVVFPGDRVDAVFTTHHPTDERQTRA